MTTSPVKGLTLALLAFLAQPAHAQMPDAQTPAAQPAAAPVSILAAPDSQTSTDGRDASFMQPVKVPPATAAGDTVITPVPPPVSLPRAAPEKPTVIDTPVESSALQGIDPDAIGLLSPEGGGLGPAMWQATPRALVEHLLPALTLPTASPALNSLAQRFLLTTANVPEGAATMGSRSLTSMRVEKLVALGDAADAWNLALLARLGQVDDATLRLAAEAALIGSAGKDVCAKLPAIIQMHAGPEWQKSLVVCQLIAGDTQGAQLSLEVLHAQNIKDDIFFQLAEHNILGGAKSLPRQMTPLKPLNMALLRLIDQPLPPEIYSRPEPAAVLALLEAKARDDDARLALAEKSAAHGLIGTAQLADAYRRTVFTPEQLAAAPGGQNTGARQRARLYQTALQEKIPQKRLEEATQFMQSLDAGAFGSVMAGVMAEMIGAISPSPDYVVGAPAAAHIMIVAGKPKEALDWLKIARQAALSSPNAAAQLQTFWPLVALAGIETDSDYGQTFGNWLDNALKDADYARREQIGGILLTLDAAGFAVPEKAWARVIDVPAGARRAVLPPLLIIERLRLAGIASRRGETVLYALAAANTGTGESSLLAPIETIRALRLAGLTADALALARETAANLLMPAADKADH